VHSFNVPFNCMTNNRTITPSGYTGLGGDVEIPESRLAAAFASNIPAETLIHFLSRFRMND